MSKLIIKNRYATIPNELLNNPEISLKAKGLFGYLQSKPDDWDFSKKRIARQVKEGLTAIKTAFKELKENGYLKTIPVKDKEGKWAGYNYILSDKPDKPKVEKTGGQKTLPSDNHIALTNQDSSKKDLSNNNISKDREKSEIKNFTTPTLNNSISEDSEKEEKKLVNKSHSKKEKIYSRNVNVNEILKRFAKDENAAPIKKWDRTAAYNLCRKESFHGIKNVLRMIDDFFKEKESYSKDSCFLPTAISASKFREKFLYIEDYFKMNKNYDLINGEYFKNTNPNKSLSFDEFQTKLEKAGGVIWDF